MNCRPVLSAAPALLLLAAACGCGGSDPKTYAVQGKVVYKGQAGNVGQLAGGRVRFQSLTDPAVTGLGEIEEDGSFALGTFFHDKSLPGVPAGRYKVRLDPPGDDDEGKAQRGLLHPKYLDFDKSGLTFTVPASGDLVLEVERPGR